MNHDIFDIDYWMGVFPLDDLRADAVGKPKSMQPKASAITSPRHIAINEQLRVAAIAKKDEVSRIPTDVFVYHHGESDNRAVTKISGLPYRSIRKSWPLNSAKEPLAFVGQLSFVNSKDITGPLPGDILLIFADADKHGYDWSDPNRLPLYFEWVSLNEESLITADKVPLMEWKIDPCFGSIFRTFDYPGLNPFDYPDISQFIAFSHPATKIGGVPTWVQYPEKLAGKFLGQINSTAPVIDEIYPYINSAQPISFFDWHDNHPLLWGDMGILYLFIDKKNKIRWTIQGS